MAKELPFFKFEPSLWENGNIQICSFEAQGVFVNVCSMYWQRLGDLPYKLAVQKACKGNATALDSLCDDGIIKLIDGMICIDFLNEQLAEFGNTSKVNSENARSGWEKRRKDATAKRPQSDRNAIREEKRREDERIEDKKDTVDFSLFWNKYEKKVGLKDCKKKWDKLPKETQEKILAHLDIYIPATPDPTYRKNPETYLNNESWNDEVIPVKEKTLLPRFL